MAEFICDNGNRVCTLSGRTTTFTRSALPWLDWAWSTFENAEFRTWLHPRSTWRLFWSYLQPSSSSNSSSSGSVTMTPARRGSRTSCTRCLVTLKTCWTRSWRLFSLHVKKTLSPLCPPAKNLATVHGGVSSGVLDVFNHRRLDKFNFGQSNSVDDVDALSKWCEVDPGATVIALTVPTSDCVTVQRVFMQVQPFLLSPVDLQDFHDDIHCIKIREIVFTLRKSLFRSHVTTSYLVGNVSHQEFGGVAQPGTATHCRAVLHKPVDRFDHDRLQLLKKHSVQVNRAQPDAQRLQRMVRKWNESAVAALGFQTAPRPCKRANQEPAVDACLRERRTCLLEGRIYLGEG
ncbi:hypothetical protein FN846DRAFT_1019224 [Sphaerosporella brunnea]|uniref:Uncharacterized protein n=1 Tax=Sphaerosporella brunnea TaxID=1250544 RepID=A0A5J5F735_9PEZI|nr:hypothetical protein FN846DRAFT_1019224 [Sphaerosporella brunnea]